MSTSNPAERRRSSRSVNQQAADLRLAVTRLARRLRQLADSGLSPSQLSALSTVERRGPMTLGELAAAEGVQPPTVTAAVARLEEAGLVARATHERDRRISMVAVTSPGLELLRRSRRAKEAFLARGLSDLDEGDRDTLARAAALLEDMLAERPNAAAAAGTAATTGAAAAAGTAATTGAAS
ncbi:MAG TPA: MarR family transcriptional regulator [Actinomycetota bacterium]|nr:MarR family transcriptional regulator [Actinomycetota bacterium]